MKRIMRTLLLLPALILFAGISNAGFMPYAIGDIEEFLKDSTYFNGYMEHTSYDFSGEWQYTAIAYESGNINYIRESPGGTTTFTTATPGNFGTYDAVNFDTDNLYFSDSDGPVDVALDAFGFINDHYFRVFELTADSDFFAKGSLIVGFNDNFYPYGGDRDFDDIIVAMNASPVPEPGTIILLGAGLIGFAALARKKIKK